MPNRTSALRIDAQPAQPTSGGSPAASSANVTPPSVGSIEPVENLALTTGLDRSAVTPTAYIAATWDIPPGVEPTDYLFQRSESSSFPAGATATDVTRSASTTIHGLKTGTTYYTRVAARVGSRQSAWSDTISITTALDITAPTAPSGLSLTWNNDGSLVITWTPSASPNLRDTEVAIYSDSGKTTQYQLVYRTSPLYEFTAAMNGAATSGIYDASLYVEIRSRSWGGIFSATSVSASATKSAPTTPSLTSQSWSADAGAAGPDLTVVWSGSADTKRYTVTLDGKVFNTTATRITYALDANRTDHSGTPDPVISYSVVAYDALGQASPTLNGTATNAAPTAPAISLVDGVGYISAIVTSTPPADFAAFEYVWKLGSTAVRTLESTASAQQYEAPASGSYTVVVRVKDMFGQYSPTTTSSAISHDSFTTADLRTETSYSDSAGTAAATLAGLKDDDRTTTVVTYAASSSWRWIEAQRTLLERSLNTTVAATPSAGSTLGYLAISTDGTTYTFYSGPLGSDGRTLTLIGSGAIGSAAETSAQAAAIALPSNGVWALPSLKEARFIRLGFRNASGSTAAKEFYPNTLVVADQIRAGDIKAIHIGAASITADRMSVTQLSAIAANLGTITAGTITGATIRTAASGERWEATASGARTYNSSNQIQIEMAAGNGGSLNAYGLSPIIFKNDSTDTIARGYIGWNGSNSWLFSSNDPSAVLSLSMTAQISISAAHIYRTANTEDTFELIGTGNFITPIVSTLRYGVAGVKHLIQGISLLVDPTGVGTDPQAAIHTTGQLLAEDVITCSNIIQSVLTDTSTNTAPTNFLLRHRLSSGAAAAGFGVSATFQASSSTTADQNQGQIQTTWVTATHASRAANMKFLVFDSGGAREFLRGEASGTAPKIGVLGATPAVQQAGGAKTAAGTYGANEQSMLQIVYNTLRTFGFTS